MSLELYESTARQANFLSEIKMAPAIISTEPLELDLAE